MTKENRETMHRALGILNGAAFGAAQRIIDALSLAVEMLDNVLESEAKNEDNSKSR